MTVPEADTRSESRKADDNRIAAEPALLSPDLPADVRPRPVEDHLRQVRKPVAVLGVVENGLVRPLDPKVKLPEQARVIIVAQEPA